MGSQHIDLGGFLDRFDQAEGLVHGLAGAVDAVHAPDHQTKFLHLLSGGLTDGIGAAEHPGQNTHTVREHHDALGAHLPQGVGELLLVQLVNIVHGKGISRMAVHDHPVFGINGQSCHVAHEMGRELGGEPAAVLIAPQQLGSLAVGCNTDDAQIGFRIIVDILKVFAGTGDDEDLADNGSSIIEILNARYLNDYDISFFIPSPPAYIYNNVLHTPRWPGRQHQRVHYIQ